MLGVGSLLVAGSLAFGVLSPPEHCPEVTSASLRQAASETVDWFARNQNADGTWLYQYRAETDTVVDDYNVVRHAGAVMGLYMAADYGIEEAFALADRGLEWSRDGLVRGDDWAAVGTVRGDPSTGGTALLLAGLADRRAQTGDAREDELMVGLAQFLVAQTEPSGAVLATYDMAAGAPVAGVYSKYYTGEAYWALALMAQQFPDGPWGEVADRIGAYMATQRDVAEDHWPPLPDHWAAYGLADTAASGDANHDRSLTDDELAYARRQAGLFAAAVRWVGQQAGPWGPMVRGPQEPRGGGYGVIGEGLTGLWRVAVVEPPIADMRDAIGARAMCIAGMAIDEQIDADEAAAFAAPSRVQGAWFIEGETRMDDQQHVLSALVRTMSIADADATEGVGARGDAPSVWLWILALVAAFNPARVALGVPSPSGGEARTPPGANGGRCHRRHGGIGRPARGRGRQRRPARRVLRERARLPDRGRHRRCGGGRVRDVRAPPLRPARAARPPRRARTRGRSARGQCRCLPVRDQRGRGSWAAGGARRDHRRQRARRRRHGRSG